jgi:hypothetical protein
MAHASPSLRAITRNHARQRNHARHALLRGWLTFRRQIVLLKSPFPRDGVAQGFFLVLSRSLTASGCKIAPKGMFASCVHC